MINTKNKVTSLTKDTSWIYGVSADYYVVAIIAIVAYFISYLHFPATPGNTEAYFMGWFGWCDQGWYLKSAQAIAHWKLSSETYVYPLGYPLMAVPFLGWLPRHPFLIPNLFFSVGVILAFYASCRKLVTKIESGCLTIFLIVLSALVGGNLWFNSLIVPWNSIPVFFAAYLATWLLVFNQATFCKMWVVSFAIALAFFSRPPDVLFLGIIYLAGLVDIKSFKEKIKAIMILIFPCSLVLVAILVSKWVIFHGFINPYDINNIHVGCNLHDLLFKFYLIFFDGSLLGGFKKLMFLPRMPWLLLCVPGIMLLAKYTKAKFWYLMASIAVCVAIYISFNAQVPSNTFNYWGFHYFMWIFPWLGLCAYLTLTRCFAEIGKWKTIAGVLVVVLFVLIIGWKETIVAVILPDVKQKTAKFSERYDIKLRKFSGEINLSTSVLADGIRIAFSKVPSRNMMVAAEWDKFNLIIDNRKQRLYSDYNLYQLDNIVYVSFRNPINQTGEIKKVLFQYNGTSLPVVDKVLVVKKEFKWFGFIKKMLMCVGILAEDYSSYASSLKITPSAETQHTTGKFDVVMNTMISKKGQTGALLHGPYILLQPGHYQVTYLITAEAAMDGTEVGSIDVNGYMPNMSKPPLAALPLKSMHGEQTIKLTFNVNNPKYLHEFRVWVNGVGRVSIKSIRVEKIK